MGVSDSKTIEFPTLQSIFERRSLRRYHARPVPREILEQILQAGTWAPSAHNRQPWRFAVLEEFASKEGLALAMGARLRQDLERDHVPQAVIDKDVQRSYDRLTSAPVVIVVSLTLEDMDTYTDAARAENERVMAVQSTAMAGQNMLLAAHSLGLGACWMCAPLFCPDVVVDALNLPDAWQPQGIITMGYPAQERSKTREPIETRVLWR
jgi:F420 biosynthesis protein FbiB-like protein